MKPKILNTQIVSILTPLIEQEYRHFYTYRSAANYCRGAGFMKAASFYDSEAKEEAEHSEKLQKFLVDWNVIPVLLPIAAPEVFTSLVGTIETAYTNEYHLYELYEEVSAKAIELDACVFDFLKEFRDIQASTVAEYSDRLNLLSGCSTDDKFQLLMLEDKLFS